MGIAINVTPGAHPVIGLDVSTATGAVVLDAAGRVKNATEIKVVKVGDFPKHRFERAVNLYHALIPHITAVAGKPELAVIEGYGITTYSAVMLIELGTAVRWALRECGIPFIEVAPSTLKKFVCGAGKGKAKKDQMRLSAYKRWRFEHDSDNVVDAYCLAQLGLLHLGKTKPGNANDKAVMATIAKGNG